MAADQPQFPIPAIFCYDNLDVMRGMNSETIDLVYLDPPFNKGKQFHAPVGSKAEGASFADIWHEDTVKSHQHLELADTHPHLYRYINSIEGIGSRSAKWYLIFMAVRLVEIHRIMKPAASLYLHCDPTANYLLRGLLDAVFGYQNFRNEIVWCYTGPGKTTRWFPRKHDTILFYVKDTRQKAAFNKDAARIPYKRLNIQHQREQPGGIGGALTPDRVEEYRKRGKVSEDYWLEDRDGMSPVGRKKEERVDYPTQKPLALLERIVEVSSHPGDLVLDPFCGCATTCVAAHLHDRRWIGIDVSAKAYELVKERLDKQASQGRLEQGSVPAITYFDSPPHRTDLGEIKPLTGKWRNQLHGKMYKAQDGDCAGCGEPFGRQHLQIDHKIAVSKGGTDHPDNLQLLCGNCNSTKGDRPMDYLKKRIMQRKWLDF